ncbi:hypothetical protein Micbo1qcDRAFT_128443 [Microdochium bolleyi]|uniref:Uncharacterized protein n=1 Tax=Microdochium bolleyi TaxID=196109 RepID=A0A136IJX3_9PEZI|nr:hypothetical protein Micbo1qcDRAFT_128443 [Microdochium bolleyi]
MLGRIELGRKVYYVWPPISPSAENWKLSQGSKLQKMAEMAGINRSYEHIGQPLARTAFHIEDAGLRSINVTMYGFSSLIHIDPADRLQFEDLCLGNENREERCDQGARHESIIVSLSTLDAARIRYRI